MRDVGLVEMGEGEVVTCFQAVLPRFGAAELDAKALLAEIRDRSGLLVEETAGLLWVFAFDVSEYLTALGYVRDWQNLPGVIRKSGGGAFGWLAGGGVDAS
ncbi:MAG: hypothetical protein IPP47_23025 [Bryobacterales bacterium]|nr:hypothetical protein [Bryobacterales bacterium]